MPIIRRKYRTYATAGICHSIQMTVWCTGWNLIYFFKYIYCFSLHVSGNHVPIIRRKYRSYATAGICHSIQMTVWYTGWNFIYFLEYIYCFSLHVSGNHVPIIRRKYRTYATPGIYHSIYSWLSGMQGGMKFRPAYQTVICTYRVTNTRCHIGTVFSADDGHIVALNM